jgi:hypothetical protein
MTMTPGLRKFVLTPGYFLSRLFWRGRCLPALAVAALTIQDAQTVRPERRGDEGVQARSMRG